MYVAMLMNHQYLLLATKANNLFIHSSNRIQRNASSAPLGKSVAKLLEQRKIQILSALAYSAFALDSRTMAHLSSP